MARSSCIALLALLAASHAGALAFDVTGSWSLTIGLADLAGSAGSDLGSTYSSAANSVIVNVTGTLLDTEPWTVTINRSDVLWDTSLSLSMRRTTDGTGTGTISGGLTYQAVTLVAETLFQGTGDRDSVQLQLELDGVSVTIGATSLATQIVFTLLDT